MILWFSHLLAQHIADATLTSNYSRKCIPVELFHGMTRGISLIASLCLPY